MPSTPEADAASKMLAAINAKENDANLKQIQERNEQQKATMDKMALDKMIADQNLFFAIMQNALRRKLELAALQQELEQAAKLTGFANLKQALNVAKNPDGQSPLQQAFQQQKFDDAQRLLDSGAIAGPRERAAFEIALDSKAARDFGLPPIREVEKLHPVKDYGLVLGIEMTSKDGTLSQFGHIGPCYQLLTDAVTKHASTNPDFAEIANAYQFSNSAAAFSASTSQRNPEAGIEISNRIQEGKLTTIPVSFRGHTMGLSVVPDGPDSKSGYLVFTNKGLGAKPGEEGTQIYRVSDLSKIDPNFVNTMMNGHSDGTSHEKIMGMISKVTDGAPPIHSIPQEAQKVDNCSVVNSQANVEGILLCQQARDKGGFDKLSPEDFVSSKKKLDDFVHGMQVDKVAQLASAMKKDPNDVDLKNLAKAFLQQHPHAGDELRQPLEKALKQEQSYKSAFQQVKAEEQADLLRPPPNTISLAQQKVEAPQLSVPGSSPTTETSNPSEELECEDDDTEHYSPT